MSPPNGPPPSAPDPIVHFHDLVALLDQKIFEIRAAAANLGVLETDDDVIADLEDLRNKIVDDPGHCGNPSYVYR